MRKTFCALLTVALLTMVASCYTHDDRIPMALEMVENQKPDSAITILNSINQTKLSDQDLAIYSLVYTMAQNKAGQNVDHDSLIRTAYNWYKDRPNDSLYAKCLYYMGLYYAHNDSSEKALNLFAKCLKYSRQQGDTLTYCLGLFQSSRLLRLYDADRAIGYARQVVDIYNKVNVSTANRVYSLLNLAECLTYKENTLEEVMGFTQKAISLAQTIRTDQAPLADAYQDLSVFYSMYGEEAHVLQAAKASYNLRVTYDVSAHLALAQAYCQADSLRQAKALISQTPRACYEEYGGLIYSLSRQIAFSQNDINNVYAYADSAEAYLIKKNSANMASKDKYYMLMLQKEVARAKDNEANRQQVTLTIVISLFLIVLISLGCALLYQKAKLAENERKRNLSQIQWKDKQLASIRQYLIKKVDISKKVNTLKTKKPRAFAFSDDDWLELEAFVNSTDNDFIERLRSEFPKLTTKDIRFLMLIRIKVPASTIAALYSIEEKSVRQKLFLIKTKLGLEGADISAKTFIENY